MLLDSRHLLSKAFSALEVLRGIYNAFVGKFLFIHPNQAIKAPNNLIGRSRDAIFLSSCPASRYFSVK